MPTGLVRLQNSGEDHAINFCCVRHRPILGTPAARDTFLRILEETRAKYCFEVLGYVVMPDHVHLLLSEPIGHKLSTAIQVIKQRFSRTRTEEYVWEPRYYDHKVLTQPHFVEKLRYIHLNPVRRGLVDKPGDWKWSSYRFYRTNEPGPVIVTRGWAKTLNPTLSQ